MSKAYPSNLTRAQYEVLSELIPAVAALTCGMSSTPSSLVLVEGCRWRALPGDFPTWQTVYTYFRNWRLTERWISIHDQLHEWASPSEAIIDS
jgi:transposase